jgi:hypothetical protein
MDASKLDGLTAWWLIGFLHAKADTAARIVFAWRLDHCGKTFASKGRHNVTKNLKMREALT